MGQIWPKYCTDVPNVNCLPIVFFNVANALLVFSGVVAIFLIIWSGVRFITSGGDNKQVSSARSMMTYAIIGLIVVLSSYAIVFFIAYLTKTTNCIANISLIASGCK